MRVSSEISRRLWKGREGVVAALRASSGSFVQVGALSQYRVVAIKQCRSTYASIASHRVVASVCVSGLSCLCGFSSTSFSRSSHAAAAVGRQNGRICLGLEEEEAPFQVPPSRHDILCFLLYSITGTECILSPTSLILPSLLAVTFPRRVLDSGAQPPTASCAPSQAQPWL